MVCENIRSFCQTHGYPVDDYIEDENTIEYNLYAFNFHLIFGSLCLQHELLGFCASLKSVRTQISAGDTVLLSIYG